MVYPVRHLRDFWRNRQKMFFSRQIGRFLYEKNGPDFAGSRYGTEDILSGVAKKMPVNESAFLAKVRGHSLRAFRQWSKKVRHARLLK